ncbi:WD-40 repeat protein [Pirellula staleyi DSM 6068]|uniref:WD-40 repeat protein n=1 Tax=Pirellula staleyi (strain ATCC 27377 / DSM 6068 / ICPB 4128) TaxID=530564 RepID=D2QW37_PIRSD|nr:WD40 repeat domain-containing protein [Pirellula staleyi]ADB15912.1 WD-40 repeat protein [Pirellula staleyi DSM 6068]
MSDLAEQPVAIEPEHSHVVATFKHKRPLVACRIDPTGNYVFTGAEDYLVVRWKLSDGSFTEMAGHESWVRALAFSPAGDVTYSGGYDGLVLSWNSAAEKPEPVLKLTAHDGWVRAVAVSPDGKSLATCGNDGLVKLWDAATGSALHTFEGHGMHVYNVAFHPTENAIVSCDIKGNVKHWDLAEKKLVRDVSAAALYKYDKQFRADIGGARSMAFSRDGKQLALGGITNVTNAFAGVGNPAVVLIDWESGKVVTQYEGKEKLNGVAWGVKQHPSGCWIGLSGGGGGGWLYFWKEATAPEFAKVKLPDTGRDFDLHSDGLRVVVAHADSQIRVLELRKKAT